MIVELVRHYEPYVTGITLMGSSGGGQLMGRVSELCREAGINVLVEIYLSSTFFPFVNVRCTILLHVQACPICNSHFRQCHKSAFMTKATGSGSPSTTPPITLSTKTLFAKSNTSPFFLHINRSGGPIVRMCCIVSRCGHAGEYWWIVKEVVREYNQLYIHMLI